MNVDGNFAYNKIKIQNRIIQVRRLSVLLLSNEHQLQTHVNNMFGYDTNVMQTTLITANEKLSHCGHGRDQMNVIPLDIIQTELRKTSN